MLKTKKLGNIILHKPVSFYIDKTANVKINGKLTFNVQHNLKIKNLTPGYLILRANSELYIKNSFDAFSGAIIGVTENAKLTIGSGYMNLGSKIHCFKEINIGENVTISEGVTIRDSDGHDILDNRHIKTQPINIGNHVWIED